ncbi:MAG: DUF2179 domain-containing protein [Bacillota bacterium]
MATLFGYLFIFFARVIDVTFATLRLLMVVRGKKLEAAALGFFEVMIYILALSRVVGALNNPINLIVYAAGFATGSIVGSWVEERLALGYLTVEAIPSCGHAEILSEDLRDRGFGVTVINGEGREGIRKILFITVPRRNLPEVFKIMQKNDPAAFITVLDTRRTRGGVFPYRKSK